MTELRSTILRGQLAMIDRWFGGPGIRRAVAASSPSGGDSHEAEIAAEQVRLLYRQLPTALFATVVIGCLVVFVLWGEVPRALLLAWSFALGLLTLGRVWLMQRYFLIAPPPREAPAWGHAFVFTVGLSGVLWGVAGVFPLREPSLLHEMFLAFMIAGLAAGGMTTLSSFRGAYLAFVLPAILPLAVRLMLHLSEVYVVMSGMLLLFALLMAIISRRLQLSVLESMHLRFDNVGLLNEVAAARDRQQAALDGLEAEINERKRTAQALQAGNEVYRTLVDTTGTGYHIMDAEGRILDANREYVSLTGHRTLAQIQGRKVTEWTAPYDIARKATELDECLARGYVRNLEIDYVDTTGRVVPIEVNATVVNMEGERRIMALCRDISARKQAERALRQAYEELERKVGERTAELAQTNDVLQREKELFRITLASIGDAVITTDAAQRITYLNKVAEDLTGWLEAEARERPLAEVFRIVHEETREPTEDPVGEGMRAKERIGPRNHTVLICRDEREISIDTSVAPILDSSDVTIGAVLVFRDVTAQRKLAQQLSHQATHDTLTELVNRREFERRLTHLLASASPYAPHALLYLDLDQFKVVNDTCGHVAGDDLLRQISALLRTKLRARDTLARLGGDEFGVLLEHCAVPEAKRIANNLRELVHGFRFAWQDKSFQIGVSIGLVPLVHAGETPSGAMSAADSSCYAAKEKGRNRVHVYQADDSMLAQRHGEMRWMPRIQQALADERFRLYYQPIVPIASSALSGHHGEILLRMLDEEGQIVPPGAFLPAAERYGLMLAIDRWVVMKTLDALSAATSREGDVMFSINVSAQSLGAADFLDFVIERIEHTGVSPHTLCFEITETSAVSELAHVLHFIDILKARGCRFALDDFGTGVSSFSYLKTLPVDYLKIDGGFIRNLATDEIDRAMVEAVHRIGHIMGLRTIAEWVQNDAILETLREIGVDYGQGYASGEPQPLVIQ
ncbi:MAG: EAL domain-containing protein [Burkholderiales bacterium]|nr:EAL domain-containing protein [Burkholderiales bacterium]